MNTYIFQYIGVNYYPYENLPHNTKIIKGFNSFVNELSALVWVNSTEDYVYEVSITNNDHNSTIISSSIDIIIDLIKGLKGDTYINIFELTKNSNDYDPIDESLTHQINWF